MSRHVVIVGAGMAGLSAAMLLARRGVEVTVLERDATPVPTTVEAAGALLRKGTPQAGHSHAFVARGRALLRDHLPDVLDDLRAHGAREVDLVAGAPATLTGPPAPDPELVVLAARRAVVEWALRRRAEIEPGVRLEVNPVTGLLVDGGRVTGVSTAAGPVAADLVVDASGRRTVMRDWLPAATLPAEAVTSCGITYYSRFYRLHDPAVAPGPLNRGYTAGSSFDRYSCLVFPADNGTFSVTFGVLPEDKDLRNLKTVGAFERAADTVELIAPWVQAATPLGDVAVMAGLRNRYAPFASDGFPGLPGLVAIGDAVAISNPAHTRGTTLAWLSALALADALDAHDDVTDVAAALDAALCREQYTWVEDSIEQDSARLFRWAPGSPAPSAHYPLSNGEVNGAAQRDPVVWTAFTRLQNLLAMPAEVLGDPVIFERVRAVQASGWSAAPTAAPSHDELAHLLAA